MSVNQFFWEVCSALRREGFTAQPERDGLPPVEYMTLMEQVTSLRAQV